MSIRSLPALQRYEFKYLVTEPKARQVAAGIAPFMRPDLNAAGRPDNVYPISSLYLDADHLLLYRDTVEGRTSRFKLRVRAYSDDPDTPVFLEVKRRMVTVVRKTRCAVHRQLLSEVLAGRADALRIGAAQTAALSEFSRLLLAMHARPKLLVRYDREAYVGAEDQEVRVTFDRRLRVLPTERPEVVVETPRFRSVPTAGVVLELKFNDRCPRWLSALVQSCDLSRTSFSKYCNGVDSLGLAVHSQRS